VAETDKPPQGLSGECLRALFELRSRILFGDFDILAGGS
jgi:hypothetical protein